MGDGGRAQVGDGFLVDCLSYPKKFLQLILPDSPKGNKIISLHHTQFISLCPYYCKPVKMKKCLSVIRLITILKYLQWFPSTLSITSVLFRSLPTFSFLIFVSFALAILSSCSNFIPTTRFFCLVFPVLHYLLPSKLITQLHFVYI